MNRDIDYFNDSQEGAFKPNSSLNPDSDSFLNFFPQDIPSPEPTFVEINLNKKNQFLGNKRKSDFRHDDSFSYENNYSFNNSDKSETKKNIFKSQSPNNFDDSLLKEKSYLKNLKFTQDTLVQIKTKTKIFGFLVGYFFGKEYADKKGRKIKRFNDRINNFKEYFDKHNWKTILDEKDENKEAMEILGKTPYDYISNVLSDPTKISNNIKIKIDCRIVDSLFNVIDCLLIQQKKKKTKK